MPKKRRKKAKPRSKQSLESKIMTVEKMQAHYARLLLEPVKDGTCFSDYREKDERVIYLMERFGLIKTQATLLTTFVDMKEAKLTPLIEKCDEESDFPNELLFAYLNLVSWAAEQIGDEPDKREPRFYDEILRAKKIDLDNLEWLKAIYPLGVWSKFKRPPIYALQVTHLKHLDGYFESPEWNK